MNNKRTKGENVYQLVQKRLKFLFNEFDNIYVSFSGGKDSGVLLNLCIQYIREHNPVSYTHLHCYLRLLRRSTQVPMGSSGRCGLESVQAPEGTRRPELGPERYIQQRFQDRYF